MKFKDMYPQYSDVERHIHAARLERAVYVAELIAGGIDTTVRGLRRLGESFVDARRFATTGGQVKAEADRRAIESDAFLKRSVPRY